MLSKTAWRRCRMYRQILVATDGSDISTRAVEHGAKLASAVGAKLLILTVTEPFHVFSLGVDQLEYTRPEYEKHMVHRAQQILAAAANLATKAGTTSETLQSVRRQYVCRHIGGRIGEEHRPYRLGLARKKWRFRSAARKCDYEGPRTYDQTRTDCPLSSTKPSRRCRSQIEWKKWADYRIRFINCSIIARPSDRVI